MDPLLIINSTLVVLFVLWYLLPWIETGKHHRYVTGLLGIAAVNLYFMMDDHSLLMATIRAVLVALNLYLICFFSIYSGVSTQGDKGYTFNWKGSRMYALVSRVRNLLGGKSGKG